MPHSSINPAILFCHIYIHLQKHSAITQTCISRVLKSRARLCVGAIEWCICVINIHLYEIVFWWWLMLVAWTIHIVSLSSNCCFIVILRKNFLALRRALQKFIYYLLWRILCYKITLKNLETYSSQFEERGKVIYLIKCAHACRSTQIFKFKEKKAKM